MQPDQKQKQKIKIPTIVKIYFPSDCYKCGKVINLGDKFYVLYGKIYHMTCDPNN